MTLNTWLQQYYAFTDTDSEYQMDWYEYDGQLRCADEMVAIWETFADEDDYYEEDDDYERL